MSREAKCHSWRGLVFGARAEGFVRAAKNVVRNVQRHGSRPPTEAGLLHHIADSRTAAKSIFIRPPRRQLLAESVEL
jgi:hypothetical protein